MSDQIINFIGTAREIEKDVKGAFGGLSGEQLNWKFSEDTWSVGQIFDHLIKSNKLYIGNIQPVADGEHKNSFFSSIPIYPSFIGRLLKKAVNPDTPKKVKTFPVFEPASSDISENIISEFIENQTNLIGLMEATKELDTTKIKIPTPVSEIVPISLSDAFEVLVMHERRHFNQAKRVFESAMFPG